MGLQEQLQNGYLMLRCWVGQVLVPLGQLCEVLATFVAVEMWDAWVEVHVSCGRKQSEGNNIPNQGTSLF